MCSMRPHCASRRAKVKPDVRQSPAGSGPGTPRLGSGRLAPSGPRGRRRVCLSAECGTPKLVLGARSPRGTRGEHPQATAWGWHPTRVTRATRCPCREARGAATRGGPVPLPGIHGGVGGLEDLDRLQGGTAVRREGGPVQHPAHEQVGDGGARTLAADRDDLESPSRATISYYRYYRSKLIFAPFFGSRRLWGAASGHVRHVMGDPRGSPLRHSGHGRALPPSVAMVRPK